MLTCNISCAQRHSSSTKQHCMSRGEGGSASTTCFTYLQRHLLLTGNISSINRIRCSFSLQIKCSSSLQDQPQAPQQKNVNCSRALVSYTRPCLLHPMSNSSSSFAHQTVASAGMNVDRRIRLHTQLRAQSRVELRATFPAGGRSISRCNKYRCKVLAHYTNTMFSWGCLGTVQGPCGFFQGPSGTV